MTAIRTAILNVGSGDMEVFHQFVLQAGAIQRSQCRNLWRFQTWIQQSNQAGDVCRIKDDNDMFYVRAILTNVFSELSGNLCISFQQIFAGHTCLTGCSTGRNNIRSSGQRFLDIGSIGKVDTFKTAMIQFFSYSFQSWCEWIIETNIRSEFHHHGCLCHVGADHSGSSHNRKFLVG